MYRALKDLFKMGIVVFVLISAAAGYAIGHTVETQFSMIHFLLFMLGTFLISSGSLGLNQVQEAHKDSQMDRTQKRPIPSGVFNKKFATTLCVTHIVLGSIVLYLVSPLSMWVGIVIIFLYNGLYTLHWKPRWMFAAVPGAIPGALPGVLGFSAVNSNLLSSECIYLFLVMFLWQMPHYWTLAIKFKDDYAKAHFPILPVVVGKERTLYHMAFYVVAYSFLAIMSPFFIHFSYVYFLVVLPFAVKVTWEFLKYVRSTQEKAWLHFFLWTNFSLLIFLFAPVIDKWAPLIFEV